MIAYSIIEDETKGERIVMLVRVTYRSGVQDAWKFDGSPGFIKGQIDQLQDVKNIDRLEWFNEQGKPLFSTRKS